MAAGLALCTGLALSASAQPAPPPGEWLTGTPLADAARTLEADIREHGLSVLVERVDHAAFFRRMTADRPALDYLTEQSADHLVGRWLEGLIAGIGEVASFAFLRTAEVEGTERARFRVLDSNGGIEYYDLALTLSGDGRSLLVDLYSHVVAEDMSRLLGRTLELAFEGDGLSPTGQFMRLHRTGHLREAWELYPELEVPDAHRRAVLNVLVRVGMALGPAEFQEAAHEYRVAFPADPSLPLLLFEAMLVAGDFEEALASVDALDRNVGGDPFLDVLRARAYLGMGLHDEAQALARRASGAFPSLYLVIAVEVEIALDTGDHDRLGELLAHMEAEFDLNINEEVLESDPEFAAFVASEAYRRWQRTRSEGP